MGPNLKILLTGLLHKLECNFITTNIIKTYQFMFNNEKISIKTACQTVKNKNFNRLKYTNESINMNITNMKQLFINQILLLDKIQ